MTSHANGYRNGIKRHHITKVLQSQKYAETWMDLNNVTYSDMTFDEYVNLIEEITMMNKVNLTKISGNAIFDDNKLFGKIERVYNFGV